MAKQAGKMQSWQVLHYARKHLGRSLLYRIFGKKNARIVDLWCQDPKYTDKPVGAYDPLQGVKSLIDSLDDEGHCDVVRSTFAYLSSGTSCEIDGNAEITDLMPTISEEILADFRAVASLQAAIERVEDIETVETLKRRAISEIERTVARYRKDNRP